MATTNLNIRIDENLKKQAEVLFSDLGLNMSSAITVFLKSAVDYNGIPFEIKKTERSVAAGIVHIGIGGVYDEVDAGLSEQLPVVCQCLAAGIEFFGDLPPDRIEVDDVPWRCRRSFRYLRRASSCS